MIKQKSLFTALLLSGMVFSGSALAADGRILFEGKVIENSCNIKTPTVNVNLGNMAIDDFNGIGSGSSPQSFSLQLDSCPDHLTSVKVKLDGAVASNPDLFQIDNHNEPGSATGIALEIKDSSDTVVPPGTESRAWTLDPLNNDESLTFIATYKATEEKVTAGDANASVEFTLNYN